MEINWTEILIVLINALLVPFALLAIRKLDKYLDAKAVLIEDISLREFEKEIQDKALAYIEVAVKQTAQTYVDNVKKSGNWDANAQTEAFNLSLSTFKTLMGEAGTEILTEIVGNLEAWAKAQIESAVKNTKW